LASLLPVGGRVLRAGLVGALGAALAGRALYALALRLLVRNAATPRLSPLLALAAALTAALSPSFQHEGTAAGGATLAAGLGLAVLVLREATTAGDARAALALGAGAGLLFAESRVAATVVVIAIAAHGLASGKPPSRRAIVSGFAGALLVSAFFLVPTL